LVKGKIVSASEAERLANIKERVLHWLLEEDVGMSSQVIAAVAVGHKVLKEKSHPHDPAEFSRCLVLLSYIPEEERRGVLANLAKLTPEWGALVKEWDIIETVFLKEAGFRWGLSDNASITYAVMHKVLSGVKKKC
jgi:hypothetical protein